MLIRKIFEIDIHLVNHQKRYTYRSYETVFDEQTWHFSPQNIENLCPKINSSHFQLKEIADINVGIKYIDNVFVFDRKFSFYRRKSMETYQTSFSTNEIRKWKSPKLQKNVNYTLMN